MALRIRLLYAVFFVSGLCGLVYESIWSHYLKLILGHAAYAQAVVLVVFVGGMALGAWLASRFTERIANPILWYAGAEVLVAAAAFAFHPVFLGASDWALDTLLPSACAPGGVCWAAWVLAALLILPAAVLLGSTFPLMSAGVLRLGVRPGRGLAMLYFLNSAGAALGVIASGFLLIPKMGLPGTLLVAGALNALVAAAAWAVMRSGKLQLPPAPAALAVPAGGNADIRLFLLLAALTGLSSFIYEVVWIRMLTQVLGAATHSFELMLASFILGLALGGAWVRNRIDRLARPERLLAWMQIAMGLAAVATLPLYLLCFDAMAFTMRAATRSDEGFLLFNAASAAMAMAVMLPASFCAGTTLPLVTGALLARGAGERRIGQVYGINTLGAIAGVLLTVWLLMPALGLKWSLAIGALIDIALGLMILWRLLPAGAPRLRPVAGSLAALLGVAAITAGSDFDPHRLASGVFRGGTADLSEDQRVIFHRDGRTASITVVQMGQGVRSLRTNGKSDGSTDPTGRTPSFDDNTVVMLGALGLAHHPDARSAAVVGLGTGITSSVLLRAGKLERVDTIEIEPVMLQSAQYFRPRNDAALDDPRSRIVIDDARAHFARQRQAYDIIVSEPSNPWVSGVSGLFTTEFYAHAAGHLAPGGHFVQWLHLYESSPAMTGSILRAFSSVFPEFKVYASNGSDAILVGRVDGARVQIAPRAFEGTGLAKELATIGIDSPAKLAAHEAGRGTALQLVLSAVSGPPNSDFFPYVDSRAARDRFVGVSANDLIAMNQSPVPVLDFASGPAGFLGQIRTATMQMPRQLNDLASAWHGQRFLRGEALAPGQRAMLSNFLRDYALVRGWLWECRNGHEVPYLWDSAIVVAGEINAGLSPQQASALWRDVLTGRCRASLSPVQVQWIELFAAVAARDAAATQAAADRLRESKAATSAAQHEYLLLAAVVARTAQGRQDDARKVLQKDLPNIPADRLGTPWLRYAIALQKASPNEAAPTPSAPASR